MSVAVRTSKIVLVGIFTGLLALNACGKKKKDEGSGASIGAPQVYPPTALVTPTQLMSSSGANTFTAMLRALGLNDVGSGNHGLRTTPTEPSTDNEKSQMMDIVKGRLFSAGPTDLLKLVKNVDGRMAEYDSRVSSMDSVPSCLSSTAVDVSSSFSVPAATGATSFPLYGQCQETLDPGLHIMFGKKDSDWYLVDAATKGLDGSDSCIMTMAKISGTSDSDRVVDAYMAITDHGKTDNFSGSTALLHYKADVAARTLELTAGGVGIGAETMHVKTDGNFIYLITQASMPSVGSLYHACFNAIDLSSAAISNCDSLKNSLSLVTLGTMAAGHVAMGNSTSAINATEANNVDLTQLTPNFCGKISTAFSGIPAFGG